MKSLKKVYAVLLMGICLSAQAQKFEMGKVSVAELEEKQHPTDPTAVAAVLFKKGKTKFSFSQSEGFSMSTEVKTRIKIYKKEGFEWATQSVWYRLLSDVKENVIFSDAATYNLVDGKIVKTKLRADGEFDGKINKYIGEKKITMPAVKEGSVIEFEYVVKSATIGKIRDWDFQMEIPVNYSEFKTFIPEYFIYNTNFKGYITPKTAVEKADQSIAFTYRDQSQPGGTIIHSASQEKLNFVETRTTYTAENLPGMHDESYVNNIKNYMSSVTHELSIIKYPNQPSKNFSTDWEAVTNTIYKDTDFGAEISKTGYFETDLQAAIGQAKTQSDIIGTVFNFAKSRVKWNGLEGYYCLDGVKSAYKNQTGNVGEINLMLTAMMRHAGLNANPVLLSTRSNGISMFPNRTAFNYVICAVETPSGMVLLDATEPYSAPNILPIRDLNWFGRLIRKDGSSESVELMPKSLSRVNTFMNYSIDANGGVEGKIRNQFTDHKALHFRQMHAAINQDSYLETLEHQNNDIEINDYVRENERDISKPIMETYSFKDAKSIELINDKIYIEPLLFLGMDNPFKQEKREYPVDFGYPVQSKYTVNIDIPQGYAVEAMPKSLNLNTGDELGSFKYMIANSGNKIQVSVSFDINVAILPADYYDVIKEFYQKASDHQKEKIVLKKI